MMYDVAALYHGLLIRLGYQTERGVMKVGFVLTKWLKEWPGLEASVWVTLPNANAAYQAKHHMDGDLLVWDVQDTDTAVAGVGKVEVLGMVDGVRKLSAVANTVVEPSILVATSEPPESQQPWYEAAMDAAARAEEAAKGAAGTQYSPDDAGKLLYIGTDGKAIPLALGAGLEIVDGVLYVTGGGSVAVTLMVDEDGHATLSGATLTVGEDGNAEITGGDIVSDGDGNATID